MTKLSNMDRRYSRPVIIGNLLCIYVIIALCQSRSIFGQNAPEGIILTTKAATTTLKPTTKSTTTMEATTAKKSITERKTTSESRAIPTEITTTESPTTKVLLTTLDKIRKKKGKNDSKKTKKKAKESKSKSDKSKNAVKKNKEKSKEINNKIKENKKKNKEAKKKLRETKKNEKEVKKKMKEKRKETKILFKQAKSRLKELKRSMKRKFRLTDKAYMKSFLRNCTLLFRSIKSEKKRRKEIMFAPDDGTQVEEAPNGFEVVKTMNDFGNSLALQLENERRRRRRRKEILPISSDGIEMEVSVLNTKEFKGYKFPDPNSNLNVADSILLPNTIFSNAKKDNATIISFVYDAFYEMTTESKGNESKSPYVNSKVVSTTVDPKPTQSLADPVEIILSHLKKPNTSKPECVFWQVNESNPDSGHWSSEGCKVHTSNQTHTVCHCNHLTDFAVLFRISDKKKITTEHKQALTIVSLVGCLVSSVCLMITVVVFIVLRKLLRSTRNLVHFNLAVALSVANILMLLSGKAVADRNVCISVSLCLYYFFLSAFCWMLGEGIYIWIMVAKAFSENLKAWMYLCIGWGIPFVIVAVAFAVLKYDLIATEFCWLSVKKGAIWSFAGPVIFVIVVNFGILVKVLCTAMDHHSNEGRLKVSARLTLLLLPILGLTWVFGLFAMNEETVVFEYLFTFFNSCQGIFIFLCYIALNAEVKNEYQKWRAKKEYTQSLQMKTTSSSGGSGDRRSRLGTQNETTQMIS